MSERATPETDAFYLRRVCAIDEEGIRAEWKHCERHARRLERERDENEGAFRVWRRRCEEAERQRDALAEALRESMMACDHILLADARDIRDWRNDVLRMQGKMRALLAELEAKR